jgi:hypothetical protein
MFQQSTEASPFTLMLEDHCNVSRASPAIIEQALEKMRTTPGPTFIQLKDANGSFAQAGGYADQYRVESLDDFGEGWQRYYAAKPDCPDRSPTAVLYRNKCVEGIHPYRQCPFECTVAHVLSYQDMWNILMHYAYTGKRATRYTWENVTQIDHSSLMEESGIQPVTQIVPKNRSEPHSKTEGN